MCGLCCVYECGCPARPGMGLRKQTVHMQLSHPAWALRTEFGALNDPYMLVTAEPWGQSQALYFNLNI